MFPTVVGTLLNPKSLLHVQCITLGIAFFSQKPCRTSTIYDLILQVYIAGGMSSRSECSKREPLLRSEASMDHTHVVVNKNTL